MKIALMLIALVFSSNASAASYSLKAAGLNCNFCAFTIERLLGKIEGIDKKSIDVDVKTGLIVASSREGAFPAPERLKEAIEKGGYSFRSMELSADGKFVQAAGGLGFLPDGAQEPLLLTEPLKEGKEGTLANIHAAVEFGGKGAARLKIEHFKAF